MCRSGMASRPRSLDSRSATGLPHAVLGSVRPSAVSDFNSQLVAGAMEPKERGLTP